MGTVLGISSAVHYVMYVTIGTVSIQHTVRVRVDSANIVIAFLLLHCAELCAKPFRLKERRSIHRFSCGSGGCVWGFSTPYMSTQCLRGTVRGTVGVQCHARALHSVAHGACTAVAQRCPSQVPRKHPFSHFPERGVHSVRHSVRHNGGNDIGNGHIPAPCCAQCSAQCPAPGVPHLLSGARAAGGRPAGQHSG